MLVLSRRRGQKVLILDAETEDILCTVTVAHVHGDKISLGFEAPDDIIIHRKEVMDRIKKKSTPTKSTEPLPPEEIDSPMYSTRDPYRYG
jgi:carbon storage regulator